MPPKLKFTEGEKVLCFHGPLIYEAKALRHQVTKDKQVKYFIHYAGWNKNWDEWVPENRVLKYNEANVQRQKEVSKLHASGSAKNKKGAVGATAAASAKPKKTDSTSSSGKDVDSRASTPSKELKDAAAVGAAATPSGTPTPSSAATTPVPSGAAASNTASNTPNVSTSGTSATSVTPAAAASSGGASATAVLTATPVTSNAVTTAIGSAATNSSARGGRSSKPSASLTPTGAVVSSAASADARDESKKKRARLDTSSNSTLTSTPSAAVSAAISGSAAATLAASAETEEQFNAKVEIKIKIPDDLKPWLVDDWDAINQQQKLLELPAKTTVQDIVSAYIAHKKSSKQTLHKEVALTDITSSLVNYFDVMLGCQLLYKFERPQYAELREAHPDKPMSALYGAFHLLRLFTRLGSMLAFTSLDEKSVQLLLAHLQDFLKFLVKNAATLFSIERDFVNVTSEYHRKVQ